MTVTDYRAAAREDRNAAREQDRADRLADQQANLAREQARREDRRRDQAAAAEQRRKDEAIARKEAERRRRDRAEARAQRAAATRAWLKNEADTVFALVVMACAIIPAVVSQWSALTAAHMGVVIAAALSIMLESAAWVATVGGARAAREGRPVRPYRIAMWGAAAIAAGINFLHGSAHYGLWVGLVLAVASLMGVAIWELRSLGRHGTSARTREQRAQDRAQARHARRRWRRHRAVRRTALDLWAAAPFGSLTREQAWAMAWEIHHGSTEPGLTAALEARRAASRTQLAKAREGKPEQHDDDLPPVYVAPSDTTAETAAEAPEESASPQVTLQNPPAEIAPRRTSRKASQMGGRVGPGNPPIRRKGDSTLRYHRAARELARTDALEYANRSA